MIYIQNFSSISSLGAKYAEIVNSLTAPYSEHLTYRDDLLSNGLGSYFGVVKANLPDISKFKAHNTRNNQFLAYCIDELKDTIEPLISKYGKDRVAVVLGTSTSGLNETEIEIEQYLKTGKVSDTYHYSFQEFSSPSEFVSQYLDVNGPAYTISTACSSSARALISAKRLLQADMADVVIAGGADTLCAVPINGFNSMEVLSHDRCLPFNKNRHGINIGEGAGIMILTKEKLELALVGCGESSDAYHVSSPDPSGAGAVEAIKMALNDAKLTKDDIGYINLHGTATKLNDAMESQAVSTLFGETTPCSSTKYLTGHTLGAAGIVEACILCYLLKENLDLPMQDFSLDEIDDTLPKCGLITDKLKSKTPYMMSNSFAFGGNNASIIIGKV